MDRHHPLVHNERILIGSHIGDNRLTNPADHSVYQVMGLTLGLSPVPVVFLQELLICLLPLPWAQPLPVIWALHDASGLPSSV